jgi:hypothetical protein
LTSLDIPVRNVTVESRNTTNSTSFTEVIPNVGYAYPPVVQTSIFRGTRKKLTMPEKRADTSAVTTYKFEITVTILITNILLI